MHPAAAPARGDAPAWRPPPGQIYQLSRDQNVIHIVLDAFLSEMFAEVIERERSTFDRDFSGFTFFADHLGAFPTTRASMPAMLTGIAYRNEMPLDPFIRENIRDRSIFSVLAGQGYQINSVTFHNQEHPPASFPNGQTTARYTIPTPHASYRDYVQFAAVQLLDLSLFRHVPHGFKSRVYNEQAWLLETWYSERRRARNARPSNHAAFLEEFAGRMTIAHDEPVYTFIHVALPHPPYVVDADCSFIGPQRASRLSYAGQGRCALAVVQRLFDRLRNLGVYDRTVIVLTSDHGWNRLRPNHPLRGVKTPAGNLDDVAVRAMPLLAVKPAGSLGPLRTSYAPKLAEGAGQVEVTFRAEQFLDQGVGRGAQHAVAGLDQRVPDGAQRMALADARQAERQHVGRRLEERPDGQRLQLLHHRCRQPSGVERRERLAGRQTRGSSQPGNPPLASSGRTVSATSSTPCSPASSAQASGQQRVVP